MYRGYWCKWRLGIFAYWFGFKPENKNKEVYFNNYDFIQCSPHGLEVGCKSIQDQLRPYDYDLEAWQLAHPHKMYEARPELFEQSETRDKWLNAIVVKIEKTQIKLQGTGIDKVKKIKRLKLKLQNLGLIKKLIEERAIFEDSLKAGVRWYDRQKEDKATQTEVMVEMTKNK